ncbi:MAG: hypothetical protein QXP60_08755 [Nitrososphaerota archaeon]
MFYVNILKKYIKILLISLMITIIAGLFYLYFFYKTKYLGTCVISPPYIYINDKFDYAYTPNELENIIKNESFLKKIAAKLNTDYSVIKSNLIIRFPTKTNYIVIIYENYNKEIIIPFLNNILFLLKEIDNKYEKYIDLNKNLIEKNEREIIELEKKINDLLKNIQELNKFSKNKIENYLEYTILWQSYSNLYNDLIFLKDKIYQIEEKMNLSEDFKFINDPTLINSPWNPNKFIIILLSSLCVLIIVFIILLIYDKRKQAI